MLHDQEISKHMSGRPPAMLAGAQLLLTLKFWREYRTYFDLAQDWDVHETTVLRTVVRVENALLQSGRFSLPAEKTLRDAGTVFTVVVVDVSEVLCERLKKSSVTGAADQGFDMAQDFGRLRAGRFRRRHTPRTLPFLSLHRAEISSSDFLRWAHLELKVSGTEAFDV